MKKELSRLVLIDGNAILHRAYHALPRMTGKGGAPINAIYGFFSMLLKILVDLKPAYLAVAFDTPKPTFRQAEFVGYQAQRPKMEAELAGQIDRLKEALREMGIAIFEKPGWEADDVIGTMAKKVQNGETIIVSGDRDLMQLVNKNTKMYLPIRGLSETELVDEKGVKKKLGVVPIQIPDYKGLVGDPSDNYPGVPGVGPKTAVELLRKYGKLESVYRKIETIKDEKIKEKLVGGKESAVLSKKLAVIVTDVPIEADWERMRVEMVKKEKMVAVLGGLGFKSLVQRVERGNGGGEGGLPAGRQVGGDEGGGGKTVQGKLF